MLPYIIAIIILLLVYFVVNKFITPAFYWRKKNVFHVNFFSKFCNLFISSKSFFEMSVESYKEFPQKRYFGSYQALKPALFVTDLNLIKKITVKDFEHFTDHADLFDSSVDPILSLNLFSLKGQKWKNVRSTLSPAFTSAKMRSMYKLIQEIANNFTNHFLENNQEVIEAEIKDVYSRFTNDVIASCAFGIVSDSLKNKQNEFFDMGQRFSTPSSRLKGIFVLFFPRIYRLLRGPIFPSEFFKKLVLDMMEYRQREKVERPDMIHLLMEAKKGRLRYEEGCADKDAGYATVDESSIGQTTGKMVLTDDLIAAQALIFFVAGFDTTSTILSFLSYELALNTDVQDKLQQEIDQTNTNNKKISYEEVLKMKYLDQIVSETLRKYPPGYVLTRICTKDYTIPAERGDERDFMIEKGSLITIPVAGVHMDDKYFKNPKKFDPDRFSEANKKNIMPGSYMPFGSGPRNCIASRFALLQAKALVVSLFSEFNIIPVAKTEIPIRFSKTFNIASKNGVWLGLQKRNVIIQSDS